MKQSIITDVAAALAAGDSEPRSEPEQWLCHFLDGVWSWYELVERGFREPEANRVLRWFSHMHYQTSTDRWEYRSEPRSGFRFWGEED